jgi:hypothetical protein
MPDLTLDPESRGTAQPSRSGLESTASAKYFAIERRQEARKRFASYTLWAGLLSLLMLMIPNPVPWLFGPLAIALGVHALLRVAFQPARYAGVTRALIGMGFGLLATIVCLRG